jgi:hypothetical protein
MFNALLLAGLLILTYGILGYAISPIFFLLLIALLALGGYGGYRRDHL